MPSILRRENEDSGSWPDTGIAKKKDKCPKNGPGVPEFCRVNFVGFLTKGVGRFPDYRPQK